MSEQYKNNAASTTAGTINNSSDPVTFSVNAGDGALFPATTNGSFRIIIDNEILLVTSRTVDSFTASRAQESTTIASHASAAAVTHVITAGAMDQIRQDLHGTGTYASLPAAQKAGNLYLPTDGYHLFRDTGAAQVAYGPLSPMTPPPAPGSLTWVNQGSATITQNGSALTLYAPFTNSVNVRSLVKSMSPKTTVIFRVCSMFIPTNFIRSGVMFRESATGKMISLGQGAGSDRNIVIDKWTNSTTYASTPYQQLFSANLFSSLWFKLALTANVTFSVAPNGVSWKQLFTEPKATFFTSGPDQWGLYIDTNTGAEDCTLVCDSWTES